jgi:hypothetical protein
MYNLAIVLCFLFFLFFCFFLFCFAIKKPALQALHPRLKEYEARAHLSRA